MNIIGRWMINLNHKVKSTLLFHGVRPTLKMLAITATASGHRLASTHPFQISDRAYRNR